jgi:outer membrane protein assembly factor BamB
MAEGLEQTGSKGLARAIPVGLVIAAVASLYLWFRGDAATGVAERLPIPENVEQDVSGENDAAGWESEFVGFDGVAADLPGSWPRFRGANFDAISSDNVKLARTWATGEPPVLWSIELGEGYAGAAVLAGRVYVLDYDRERQADAIRCFSLADGREIWRYSYPVKVKRWHGMSRTVPAVSEKYIVTMGPKCHVTCLDAVTGEFRWMLDLVKDFGASVPEWYAGQCPLLEEGKAIIAPGGTALMMAVDCDSGEIVWESPNPDGSAMTHSSIMPMESGGRRMYVYCGGGKYVGGVVGVSADDGAVLWKTTKWKMRTNVPSPVILNGGLIFLSAGYNAGSMMIKLVESDGQIMVEEVFRLEAEVFGAEQQTPIFFDGHLYGIRQDKQLVCLDLEGNVIWASGSNNKFGLGPFTIVNGLIYAMNDSGLLRLIEGTPAGYIRLSEAEVLEGPESWGPMAVAAGRLILRDLNRMICLDVTEQ